MTAPTPVNATPTLRTLIVDDSAAMVELVAEFLLDDPDIEVVGSAATKREAIEMVASTRPAVVLMDSRLLDASGAEATLLIKARWPDTVVLFLTSDASPQSLRAAKEAGAAGYLLKPEDLLKLAGTIRRTLAESGGTPQADAAPHTFRGPAG